MAATAFGVGAVITLSDPREDFFLSFTFAEPLVVCLFAMENGRKKVSFLWF